MCAYCIKGHCLLSNSSLFSSIVISLQSVVVVMNEEICSIVLFVLFNLRNTMIVISN